MNLDILTYLNINVNIIKNPNLSIGVNSTLARALALLALARTVAVAAVSGSRGVEDALAAAVVTLSSAITLLTCMVCHVSVPFQLGGVGGFLV